METLLAALISGGAAIMVCMINNHCQGKAIQEQHNKTIALIEYRLDELQTRVDKHNKVVERTYKLEELTALQEEKISVANHRIEDLEREK